MRILALGAESFAGLEEQPGPGRAGRIQPELITTAVSWRNVRSQVRGSE